MTKQGIIAAGLGAFVLALGSPASADDIGRWGAWGRPPEHLKGGPASQAVSKKADEPAQSAKAAETSKSSPSEKPKKIARKEKSEPVARKPATAVSPAESPAEPAGENDVSGSSAKNEPDAEAADPASAAAPTESAAGASDGGDRPDAEAEAKQPTPTPAMVRFDDAFDVYAVVIDMGAHKLYYTLPNNTAFVYPVAVGKECLAWVGQDSVTSIEDRADQRRSRSNPQGDKVIHVNNPQYRIHGTNDENAIQKGETQGCVAMTNNNAAHLANLVEPGTAVLAVPSLHSGATPAPGEKAPADNI